VQRTDVPDVAGDVLRIQPVAPEPEWLGFPSALSSFFGREQEIADVAGLLRNPRHRLITLVGPGGVGKTRLALAVAEHVEREFPGGAAFIPLAPVSQADQVPGAVASVLGVRGHPERTTTQSIASALQGRRFLIILDNLEHLTGDNLRAFVQELLEVCPLLTILATSREPLRLTLERRYMTRPLSTSPGTARGEPLTDLPSLQLFVARAEAVRHDFTLGTGDAEHIVDICRRLDGLPLAIELAAAWMRLLTPAALRERLQARLPLLIGGSPDQPVRLQTMSATIAWSYDLLPPAEAAALRRLSVFRGGFTLEAAAVVVQPPREDPAEAELATLNILGSLCDKSLLQPLETVGAIQRFGMLETVREFAHERLVEAGELADAKRAHATYYCALTERVEPILLGPDEGTWMRLYDAEMGNLREAMAWGLCHEPEVALRIAGAVSWFWTWFHMAEARDWLARALAAAPAAPPHLRARALAFEISIAFLVGDASAVQELLPATLDAAEHSNDPIIKGHAAWLQAIPPIYAADLNSSDAQFDRSLEYLKAASTPSEIGLAAFIRACRGDTAFMRGQRALGISLFEEALAQLRTIGGSCFAVVVLSNYAGWLLSFDMSQRAREVLQEAARLASTAAVTWQVATTLVGLALADAMEGKALAAARRLGALDAIRVRADLMTPFFYQDRIDRATQLARDELGPRIFEREWEAGYADPAAIVATMQEDAGSLRERHVSEMARKLGLTLRELQVLELVAAGKSDREIAAALFISVRTASKHVGSIRDKMGVASRAEAAVRALQLGLA
jgi:predicted ATPase/DNA-binding CsgD family transcriptional regulator